MQIEKKQDGSKLLLRVVGRLDTNTSPMLDAELKLDGINELEFDIGELEYVSSAGLRVFLGAQKAMNACGGKMTIKNPNATVKNVFDITGCSGIFNIV